MLFNSPRVVLFSGRTGGNPLTFEVQDENGAVNPISTVVEREFEISQTGGAESIM